MSLTAHDLVAGFHGREPVLRGAHLSLGDTGRVALLGANGSGKTTLLRCLSGAHKPTSGTVERDGLRLAHGRTDLHEHRRAVQLVLQDPDDQLFSADVTGDVSFGPLNLCQSREEAAARVAEVLAELSITHLANRPTHHLSYGERKRVALAGAVAMRPRMLLLDEPTAGLDPAGTAEAMAVLERLHASGTALLVATHDVDLALAWADEVAVVSDGVVIQGPATQILADETVLRAARLDVPWPLALASRLGLPGRPRTIDEVAALITPPQRPPQHSPKHSPRQSPQQQEHA